MLVKGVAVRDQTIEMDECLTCEFRTNGLHSTAQSL